MQLFFVCFFFVEDHDSAPRDEQQTQQDAWHHLSQPRRTLGWGAGSQDPPVSQVAEIMEFAPGRRTGDGPVGVRTRTGSPRCFPPPVCLSAPSSSSSSAGPSLSRLLPLVLSCPRSAASGLAASHCCGPGQEGPLRSRGWGAAPRPLALLRGLSALGTVTAQAGRPAAWWSCAWG